MSTLKRLAINDEGFVFDPATGDSYLLNPTGAALLRGLQEQLGDSELLDRLLQKFDVEPTQAAGDLDDFLMQLRALRIL
jgi:PqqD family protein of HPr-rel-A system